ncbi:MAG: replication initiation protein [Pseudoalteromonas tetraodonis]|nr:replication initiation protein [Pseudoalteromonas tetraodonis]
MNKLTVVQHNALIESSYRLDLDEMRLLNLALTKIDSRKPNIGIIEIFPDEFSAMFNLSKKNIWRNMKNSLNSIMTKPVRIKFLDGKGKPKERLISWLGSTEYFTEQCDGTKIELNFTEDITPYLFELKANFTKVNFEYVSRLSTPFSFRLYQWLTREYKMEKGGYYDLTMTLETIKKRAGFADKSYPQWRDFKSRVIQPAVDAINQKTNLSVSYSVTKQGKKAHSLTFTYIDEVAKVTKSLGNGEAVDLSNSKPIRPRLLRRPKVKAGSHEEGEWQKANLKLLSDYLQDLKAWDPAAKLTMADLKKLVSYSKIFDQSLHAKMHKELLERQKKR